MSDTLNSPEARPRALKALVRGRVQGVGFRDWTTQAAQALGLAGYAKNLPDGRSVEVYAVGGEAALVKFAATLRRGPSYARVDGVTEEWGPAPAQRWPAEFQVI